MRTAFIEALYDLAIQDDRVYLLTGDLGYSLIEPFADRFPDRFVNVGVAEQNMIGVAAGLALSGKIIFIYSIANFPLMRCLEQIRNDLCYHNLNVNIVAVGGGFGYGSAGYSHYAIEDLAVMRAMPNMSVLAPGDPIEARAITHAIARSQGPSYLRLGKAGEPVVHDTAIKVQIGKPLQINAGDDITLISTGGTLKDTVDASDLLAEVGINAGVVSMHTLKPIIPADILGSLKASRIVAIEEHSSIGGLYSTLSELVACDLSRSWQLYGINAGPNIPQNIGSQDFLKNEVGLSASKISEKVKTILDA